MTCPAERASTSGRAFTAWNPVPRQRRSASSLPAHVDGKEITLLDYGAGNVRSVKNAVHKLGYTFKEVIALYWKCWTFKEVIALYWKCWRPYTVLQRAGNAESQSTDRI